MFGLAKQSQSFFPHLADYLYCSVEFLLACFPSRGVASDSTCFRRVHILWLGYHTIYIWLLPFCISLVHLEGKGLLFDMFFIS